MADQRYDIEKVIAPLEIPAKEITGLRPRYPNAGAYGYGYSYGPDQEKINFREIMRTIRKRKWMILTLAFIVTTLVTIEMYRTKNSYQATTTIEVGKDTSTLARAGDMYLPDTDYDPYFMVTIKTKILMLTSRSVLQNTVETLKLDQNPDFLGSGGKKSVWEALKMMSAKFGIGKEGEPEKPESDLRPVRKETDSGHSFASAEDLKPYIDMVQAGMSVEPIRETKALRVSFTHTDPKIAAMVANGIADSFLSRNFENKTEKFSKSSAFLDDATRKLKAQVEEAEQRLANYTRERGIFSTDKEGTLTTAKLSSLHDQLMRAQADRMIKQSLYEEVKQGKVAELPEAFADMLFKTSPKMADIQKQLGNLETDVREMSVKLGPENPRVVEAREKIAALKEQVAASTKSLEEKLKNDYERVVRDENMLKAALAQAKGEAVQQNQDAIQFNILKQDVETAKQLYQGFLQKANQAEVQKAEQYNNLRIIEPAEQPGSPISPRRKLTILLGLFLSTAAGIGLAFFLEYLDNTIKTVEDVSRYAQLPSLSVIPAVAGGMSRKLSAKGKKAIADSAVADRRPNSQLVALDARSSAAEAYRVLRTSVLLSAAGQPPKTILITSGQPGEGKTTTAINTAISLAQLGASVLIIDCDLRRPTTHKVLGVDHLLGLSTYLARNIPLDDVIQKLPIANLSLLPCGPIPPNPAELIISDKMKNMLRELSERYDHIIIDSPPLINVTDPVILSTMVDGVILVVHGGKSTRDIVRRARQELSSVGAKIFGVVLNNVDLRNEGYDNYYYNRYYSGYAQDNGEAEASSQ